jgi:hypothetical protein
LVAERERGAERRKGEEALSLCLRDFFSRRRKPTLTTTLNQLTHTTHIHARAQATPLPPPRNPFRAARSRRAQTKTDKKRERESNTRFFKLLSSPKP